MELKLYGSILKHNAASTAENINSAEMQQVVQFFTTLWLQPRKVYICLHICLHIGLQGGPRRLGPAKHPFLKPQGQRAQRLGAPWGPWPSKRAPEAPKNGARGSENDPGRWR